VSWSGDGERGTWMAESSRSTDCWIEVDGGCGTGLLVDCGGVGSGAGESSSEEESLLITMGVDGHVYSL
jgi:hypothetical protein